MKYDVYIPTIRSRKFIDSLNFINHDSELFVSDVEYESLVFSKWAVNPISAHTNRKVNRKLFVIPLDTQDIHGINLPVHTKIRQLFPGKADILTFENKKKFAYLCKNLNLDLQFYENASDAPTKVIVKPSLGSGSRGIWVDNLNTLADEHFSDEYLVQDWIASDHDPFGFSGFALKGKILHNVSHKRLLTAPGIGGVSIIAKRIRNNDFIVDWTQSLLSRTKYTGFFMVEYIVDKELNPRIIELNPRIWGSFKLLFSPNDNKESIYVFWPMLLRYLFEKKTLIALWKIVKNYKSTYYIFSPWTSKRSVLAFCLALDLIIMKLRND